MADARPRAAGELGERDGKGTGVNPPSLVDQGFLNVEVYFYPSKPAETIVITVGQQPSGATASEA